MIKKRYFSKVLKNANDLQLKNQTRVKNLKNELYSNNILNYTK